MRDIIRVVSVFVFLLLSTACISCRGQVQETEFTKNNTKNMETLDSLVASYTTISNYYIYFTNVGCLYEIRIKPKEL